MREVCRVTRELAILDQESCQHTEYSDIFPSKKERFVKTLWSPWPTTEQGNSSDENAYDVFLGSYYKIHVILGCRELKFLKDIDN